MSIKHFETRALIDMDDVANFVYEAYSVDDIVAFVMRIVNDDAEIKIALLDELSGDNS